MCRFVSFAFLMLLALPVLAQDVKTHIHHRAKLYIPTMLQETKLLMPNAPDLAYMPALTEHETCPSLKSIKCWNPNAELKNNREQGVGLPQVTRTFRTDGSTRFDSLTLFKTAYPTHLKELSWMNVKDRPDLQIRLMVLMVKDSYSRYGMIKDPYTRYHFADVDYNGGPASVSKARTICGLAKNCDPQLWFDNTERYNPKSNVPDARYGGRSMREINNHHARDVFFVRLPKYRIYIKELQSEQHPAGPPSLTDS